MITTGFHQKTLAKPNLKDCLAHLREGDCLHVHGIDRLARNLKDLQNIIEELAGKKGVAVRFYKENLTFSGDTNPMNKLMLQMLGAFSEFERSLIKECQREGIQAAKARGQKLGAPSKLTTEQIDELKKRFKLAATKAR